MVLTLQFSAALELTNDGGLGKVALGARSMSGQNMAQDNHQGNGLAGRGQMQWRVVP